MPREVRNIGASVRARLLRIGKEKDRNFDLVLTHYAIERLLYRLAQSRHADRFVLKGALLLMTWFGEPFRGTRDLDLLGHGDPAPDAVLDVFKEILGQDQPDGVVFDTDAARVSRIRQENEYGGLRIRATADIGGARIPVNVDVGFGDAMEPPAEWLDYPVLLDMPSPRLRGYARETVVAEKFPGHGGSGHGEQPDEGLLRLVDHRPGLRDRSITSRKGDICNLRTAWHGDPGSGSGRAVAPTFAKDAIKRQQWESFKQDLSVDPGPLDGVVSALEAFLMPAAATAQDEGRPDSGGAMRMYRVRLVNISSGTEGELVLPGHTAIAGGEQSRQVNLRGFDRNEMHADAVADARTRGLDGFVRQMRIACRGLDLRMGTLGRIGQKSGDHTLKVAGSNPARDASFGDRTGRQRTARLNNVSSTVGARTVRGSGVVA